MKRTVITITLVLMIVSVACCQRKSTQESTLDDLKCDWFEVELTRGKGGFFPVFLPFKYKHEGRKERYSCAFPFLVSFKFDWVPNSVCTRHPFFIYKRDKNSFKDYRGPSEAFVRSYARRWRATHVIDGAVFEESTGWGGRLDVYNPGGVLVFRRNYKPEFGYFELMGTMVIDWMESQKREVTGGLKEELLLPMTTDMRTIGLLELAARAPERSDKEWQFYEKILEIDPDFAEVRQWRANQMWWHDSDEKKAALERGMALDSHLVVMSFTEFSTRRCPDEELNRKFVDEWIPRMREIAPDNVDILTRRINYWEGWGTWRVEKLEQENDLIDMAYEYAYHGKFLYYMAGSYHRLEMYEKSVPLYINSLNSGYLWGSWEPGKKMFDNIILGLEKKGERKKAELAKELKTRYLSN